MQKMFADNVSVGGGVAPVRAYLPELLADVLDGTIDPGRVFDLELPLERGGRCLPRDGRTALYQDSATP